MRRVPHVSLLLLSVVLGGAPSAPAAAPADDAAGAEDYVPPDYIGKPPALPPHWSDRRPRQMALSEAIEIALRYNLDLLLTREQVRATDTGRSAALGTFEPTLGISASRAISHTPPSSAQEGRAGQVLESINDIWNLNLTQRLPSGTVLNLAFNNSHSASGLGTAVAPVIFRSSLILSLNQPLLSGFSFNAHIQWKDVLRAEFDSAGARETARLTAMTTVKTTETLYWNLVETWKTYEVNRGALELAKKQIELTRRKIAAGITPESDFIDAQASLAQRQLEVVRSEAQIEQDADALRKLLNLPPDEWEQPLVPLDAPRFTRMEVPYNEAVERALAARPELKKVNIDWRRVALGLEVARNARLPKLNLNASVGLVGQDASYARTLEQVRSLSAWQWSVGLEFLWEPLGVATRAGIRLQESNLRQNHLNRAQTLLAIRADIRAAIRSIATAEQQLRAAARARDLAERSLDVEQRRFLNSLSNNFVVAQKQANLATARLAELHALILHERARSDLLLAMGELLEARQLQFDLRTGG